MTQAKIALLPDRGVVSVTGADARTFLDNMITNDMGHLKDGCALFTGLLSPQGKVLFDFFVVPVEGGYLLDVARERSADLAKRLAMYKLRAAVVIADVSADAVVFVVWGDDPHSFGQASFIDSRLAALGLRVYSKPSHVIDDAKATNGFAGSAADYHAHRIALGVPEGGQDFAYGEVFPHEVLMDQLNGVSFTKGCYVGQEIVSRMEHRGTARKRFVRVTSATPLSPRGTDVFAGDVAIGLMGSSDGMNGLALLRLDRLAEFAAKGVGLTVGGHPLIPNPDDVVRLMPKAPDVHAL
jgi:tRNA-modifying protein YgfZ